MNFVSALIQIWSAVASQYRSSSRRHRMAMPFRHNRACTCMKQESNRIRSLVVISRMLVKCVRWHYAGLRTLAIGRIGQTTELPELTAKPSFYEKTTTYVCVDTISRRRERDSTYFTPETWDGNVVGEAAGKGDLAHCCHDTPENGKKYSWIFSRRHHISGRTAAGPVSCTTNPHISFCRMS